MIETTNNTKIESTFSLYNTLVSSDLLINMLSFLIEECSISSCLLSIQFDNYTYSVKVGDFDLDYDKYLTNDSKLKSNIFSNRFLKDESLENVFFISYPVIFDDNKSSVFLILFHNENKNFSAKELNLIELTIKQIKLGLNLILDNFNLGRDLKFQNKKFELFSDNSKEIFYELNNLGEILFISESWEIATGYSVEDVLGKSTTNYVHSDDIEHINDYLSKLIPNQKSDKTIVYRIQHKEGHYVWHSSNVTLIEREGHLLYIGNCREVTDFIEAQEVISKQKEFYEKILDRLPLDLGVWDRNHKYMYLNREAIKNDELRKFIIGKDDFDYAKYTNRNDSFAVSRREKFLRALNSGEIVEWEDTLEGKNGEKTYHSRKFVPILDENGQFDIMAGYGIDITESKKINEEILKSRQLITNVIQNAAVGIIVQGPQSEFLEYNKSACDMLGLTEDQMLGKSSFDSHWKVVHLDGTEFKSEDHPVPQAISKLIPIKNVVMGVHRPVKNDIAWLLVDAIPVFDDTRELVYVVCTFNDITARKNAEDALRESNERFKYASEATSDALWDWNMTTDEIFVGETYSQLFGHHFENNKITGEFCESLVHPDDLMEYEKSIELATKQRKIKWKHEYRYLKADGSYAFVCDKAIIIYDSFDTPIRMIGAMQDVTQEKFLKNELQQSEERFKGAFNNSYFGSALVNLKGNWIEVNNRMCEILGYTKEEFKNLTFEEFTYKEDLELDLALKQKMDDGLIPAFQLEKRFIHKNQSLVWVHLSVSTDKGNDGKIQHYVAQVVDISERKRMEDENRLLTEENNKNKAQQLIEAKNWYRLLADNTIDLVCLHNLDATFKYVSPSIKNLLGYTPEDLIGAYPQDFIHPEDLEKFKNRIGNIIKNNEQFSEQVRLKNSDGEYIWFETNASVVLENDEPVSFQSSTRDITQRKKAEKIIEDTLIQERHLNELRTNLVSTISHEFRTPMTTIRTSAELISMYLQNCNFLNATQVEKRIDIITKEIDRIVGLMDAVLIISKDDANKTNFNPVVCNLKEICLEVIETSFSHQKDNRIVEAQFDNDTVEIFADVNLIKYSLFNIISNAFKYSDGGENIRLNLFSKDQFIFIEVIDNGIGIPEEDQPKLFNTFYRASNSNGIQGTGLGLYIVKMFTKKNSGKVQLESQLGKGTKVTLKFPLYKKTIEYETSFNY